ncbi:MAG: SpaA isopeptide-forming pilin-related protein, partial [Enterococcus sp.]
SQGIKTTDQYGKVGYIGLLAGKYKLVEVSTIDGYQMGGEQLIDIPNDVPANQDTLNLKIYNKKKTKLPQTGGTGSILIHLLGVLTLFSGFVFYQQKISWGEK